MDYQLADKIVTVPLRELRESPKQKHVHADFDPDGKDKWFVENIRKYGVLVPLIILPDKTVKEGHRRMWAARLVGKTDVRCMVFQDGDADAVMFSAIMHRQLSLYTKCLAYRDKIESLTNAGKAVARGNLKQFQSAGPQSAASTEQGWIEIEEVLAVRRDQVQEGVTLLARLEAMEAAKKPEERDRAKRIIGVFRNRGIKPALRLLDDRTSDEIAADLEVPVADLREPDMNQWETQNQKLAHRERGKIGGRASQAKQKTANPFTPPKSLVTKLHTLVLAYEKLLDTKTLLCEADAFNMVQAQRWDTEVAEWIDRMNKHMGDKPDGPDSVANGNQPLETTAVAAESAAPHEPKRKAKAAAKDQPSRVRQRRRVPAKAVAGAP